MHLARLHRPDRDPVDDLPRISPRAEQLASNALIRPLSEYNGPAERHIDEYVPDAATLAAAERAEESAG